MKPHQCGNLKRYKIVIYKYLHSKIDICLSSSDFILRGWQTVGRVWPQTGRRRFLCYWFSKYLCIGVNWLCLIVSKGVSTCWSRNYSLLMDPEYSLPRRPQPDTLSCPKQFNLLKPNDIYIYMYMSYRTANLQTLHFKYLFNKYTYWIF
jgi:hypothetical protein